MSNETTILLENANLPGAFTSGKKPGSGYHQKYDNLHTFVLKFSNWSGELKLQGTLEMFPGENDWFDLRDQLNNKLEYGGDSSDYDSIITVNAKGNFLWIRAIGTIDHGSIAEIRYNH
jgi:hypothetical protein